MRRVFGYCGFLVFVWLVGQVSAGEPVSAPANGSEPESGSTAPTTILGGYVSASGLWRVGTCSDPIPGRSFDGAAKQDGFNLDVVKLALERAGADPIGATYKVELLVGPDANGYNPSVGVVDSELGVKQAYVQVPIPGLSGASVKLGTFDTVIGYEVYDLPANPNYSRSYGYSLEPLSHTGVLLSYGVSDAVGVVVGAANSWSPGVNRRGMRGADPGDETEKTYMAALTLTCPESGPVPGATFTCGLVDGLSGNPKRTTSLYTGGTMPIPGSRLWTGLAFDLRFDGPSLVNRPDNKAWATGLYLGCSLSERLRVINRIEFARGTDGTWFDAGDDAVAGPKNEFIGETFTIEYKPSSQLLTRLELRWDRYTGARVTPAPFGSDGNDVLSLGVNLVYMF